jgi:hypothetical protein
MNIKKEITFCMTISGNGIHEIPTQKSRKKAQKKELFV